MTSLATVTAADIAADLYNGDLRFSLAAGRGYPGVIEKVETNEWDDDIWITWHDGNGEHTSRYLPADEVQVIVG